MLCLDQRGYECSDSFGYLRRGRVEVYPEFHPEFRPLDPYHDGAIDSQRLGVSWYKHLEGERHPDGDRGVAGHVTPAQRKIFDDSFTGNPIPEVPYRHQLVEPLILLPHDKPGHSVSFLSRSRLRTEPSSDGHDHDFCLHG